jgi:isochorismate hydrolase
MNKRKTTLSDDQLYALEEHLAGTLKPVTPPREVVQRLRERIRFPQPEEIAWRLRDWNRMFLIFGGVMSGMLVLITVARAFFYLVGRRHIG